MTDPEDLVLVWHAEGEARGPRPAETSLPLKLWSLERAQGARRYELGLRTVHGQRLVVQLQAADILAIADAVLDDLDRAAMQPGIQ